MWSSVPTVTGWWRGVRRQQQVAEEGNEEEEEKAQAVECEPHDDGHKEEDTQVCEWAHTREGGARLGRHDAPSKRSVVLLTIAVLMVRFAIVAAVKLRFRQSLPPVPLARESDQQPQQHNTLVCPWRPHVRLGTNVRHIQRSCLAQSVLQLHRAHHTCHEHRQSQTHTPRSILPHLPAPLRGQEPSRAPCTLSLWCQRP